ncbi:SDR family NAD(P)-dependent oxidoreductase [Bosea psychrotolerans]|uniref:Short-subunit dehydrogenase n=1 Tax=Bosea psychrotolerans TaxID=1871628 RepID=A0A2S4M896_9HYPH|nr:SDR family NAD(P)-dependent oxidoreductase [Bosea psychrotolerans]POR50845.1 short-subunit dehydrogenase [Bosea psychrotolerans]
MTSTKRLAIVAGAGPGLGDALLTRFAQGGYHAVGYSHREQASDPSIEMRNLDLTDSDEVRAVTQELTDRHGPPAIVVHNPARLFIGPLLETPIAQFEEAWRSMALSAAILAHNTMPAMVQAGGGAFIVSGATASLRGGAKFSAFASAKFALRGLTQSLAREFQSSGIHVAHVILDGIIDSAASRVLHGRDPAKMMKPADIAETYWQLAHQPSSVWTYELDLRPMDEVF